MDADPREWRKLPKFIVGISGVDRDSHDEGVGSFYVMHCHEPRFLMPFVFGNENDIMLLDSTDDEEHLIALMNRARKLFYKIYPSLKAQSES